MKTRLPQLQTPRLRLRPWHEADFETFAALHAHPQVAAFLPGVLDRDASRALFSRIQAHFETYGYGVWAVTPQEQDNPMGFVGLNHPDFTAAFTPCVEIAWRLLPDYWGHGYATEAARHVLNFGFSILHLPEIVSFTVPQNQRSRRVMERLGMEQDAQGSFNHPSLPAGHRLERHVLYRLSDSRWRELTASG